MVQGQMVASKEVFPDFLVVETAEILVMETVEMSAGQAVDSETEYLEDNLKMAEADVVSQTALPLIKAACVVEAEVLSVVLVAEAVVVVEVVVLAVAGIGDK